MSEPTEYELLPAVMLPELTPGETPLESTMPAVMCPVPSAVKEPMVAWKPEELKPLRVKAYCPLKIFSFPVPQAVEGATIVMLSATVLLWVGELESVTVSEKFAVPAAVGLPVRFQFVLEPLRVNHPGSVDPLATVQVYGGVPPDA